MNKFSEKKILITGGAGFIGGTLVKKILLETKNKVFNIDKLSYASDLSGIDEILNESNLKRYEFLKLDLCNISELNLFVKKIQPDYIFHLAAESHVDRSIDNPQLTIETNILGTFNLLEAVRNYLDTVENEKKENFRFIHISTDEVYGTLNKNNYFSENTRYDPQSPYSASKAASDHLVKAWNNTYKIPTLITNCSNNFGPRQFPEKLIPTIILKAINLQKIPIYGSGENIRDWLFVEDHIDALIKVASYGEVGTNYCIGGFGEKRNIDIAIEICNLLDELKPSSKKYSDLIQFVEDRPGHDYRYAINSNLIREKLSWHPNYEFKKALKITVEWYLENLDWCEYVMRKGSYKGQRLGKF